MTKPLPDPDIPLPDMPRMLPWWIIALALAVAVFFLAPRQLPVSLYKLSLVSMAAVAGYWVDRSLFPYARPDALFPAAEPTGDALARAVVLSCAMLRRALIVAAAMLATGLGA